MARRKNYTQKIDSLIVSDKITNTPSQVYGYWPNLWQLAQTVFRLVDTVFLRFPSTNSTSSCALSCALNPHSSHFLCFLYPDLCSAVTPPTLSCRLFPDTGVTPTTPIHPAISLVGIGSGLWSYTPTQRSVFVLHVCIYVAYIGT